ncbi:MAG TPA: hypothetical protein VLA00_00135 [Xanthobacteraceae bacterium]|nr:hypothetical protein [Xanthobacteraceae bacterium]
MEWLQAVLQNTPAIIKAASETGLGIVALSCLIIGAAGIIYLSRSDHAAPLLGIGIFTLMVLGVVGLSVVALFTGARRPLDLASARTINFKTPYFDEASGTYRLLDATVVNLGGNVWRELQERPNGKAEYYHIVKSIEPGRILFGRRPKPNNEKTDPTELIVDTSDRILCWRDGPDAVALQCPYALVGIE